MTGHPWVGAFLTYSPALSRRTYFLGLRGKGVEKSTLHHMGFEPAHSSQSDICFPAAAGRETVQRDKHRLRGT